MVDDYGVDLGLISVNNGYLSGLQEIANSSSEGTIELKFVSNESRFHLVDS